MRDACLRHLKNADLRLVASVQDALAIAKSSLDVAEATLEYLAVLAPGNFLAYQQFGLGGSLHYVDYRPAMDPLAWLKLNEAFVHHIEDHPGWHLLRSERPTFAVVEPTDFVPLNRFTETALYRDVLRFTGGQCQISAAVLLPGDDYLVLSTNRDKPYTARERGRMWIFTQIVRSSLFRVWRYESLLDEARCATQSAAKRSSLWLGQSLAIESTTSGAIGRLERAFAEPVRVSRPPSKLWHRLESLKSPDERLHAAAFTLETESSTLDFTLHPERRGLTRLDFSERLHSTASPTSFPSLLASLTPAEVETLHWMAKGKAASEIARILGISTPAVRGRQRSLLRKLEAKTASEALLQVSRAKTS